jgi:hypothetical protein
MAGSPDSEETPDPLVPDQAWSWSFPPTAVPPSPPPAATAPTHPPTATHLPAATHPPTQPSPPSGQVQAFTETETVTGSPQRGSWWQDGPARQTQSGDWWQADSTGPQEIVRYGPGIPAAALVSQAGPAQAVPTAEQVWRAGLPGGGPRRQESLFLRVAGAALTAILLIASVVVIYLRLHHAPFAVTGVAITQQVKTGCTVDVTGRLGTTGGAGTVSYEWTFQPQVETPQVLSQSVAAGQTSVYVAAAVEGQGHGTITQTATLRVLGPGQGSASAHIVISC